LSEAKTDKDRPTAVEMPDRFIDEKSVARLLDVSTGYLANLRCRGGGPRYYNLGKPGRGRCIRYRIADIMAWVESRAATATSGYPTKIGERP
jgi:hypothetical protein